MKELPDQYTNVPPTILKTNEPIIPHSIGPAMLSNYDNEAMLSKEEDWLAQVKLRFGKEKLADDQFISWATFYASLHPPPQHMVDVIDLYNVF